MTGGKVPTNDRALAKHAVVSSLSRGLAALVASGVAVPQIAGRCEVSARTIRNALSGDKPHLLEFDTILTIARDWPQFGSDAMALAGLTAAPINASAVADMELIAALATVQLAVANANSAASPGGARRVHSETCAIADMVRPLLPALTALVREADGLRSAA